jgi:outer membrane protein assembly factor BamB
VAVVSQAAGTLSDWPQFRHGASRGGDNTTETVLGAGNADKLKQKWATPTPGPVDSSPAVVNGVVYAGTDGQSVIALKASTGRQLWRAPLGGPVYASPAVANGIVYISMTNQSNHTVTHALSASSGKQLWATGYGTLT